MAEVQKTELHGHQIFSNALSLKPTNKGTYAFTLTLQYAPDYGVQATSTRSGIIVPCQGSTLAEVHAVLFEWMASQVGGRPGGHAVLFREVTPNVEFSVGAE